MKLRTLEKELTAIYKVILNNEFMTKQIGESVHPYHKMSAMNLNRYITLRSLDLRKVHDALSEHGISSLRSCEAYVYRNITDVLKITHLLLGNKWESNGQVDSLGYHQSKKFIRRNANRLFNSGDKENSTEIMVSLPIEAANDPDLVRNLFIEGMEIARIEIGKYPKETCLRMLANLRMVAKEINARYKIQMDLPGLNLRIGRFEMENKKGKFINFINVRRGDHIIISSKAEQASRIKYGKRQEIIGKAVIPISLPSVIESIVIGDKIYFDDGRIRGLVIGKKDVGIELVVTYTAKEKIKLRSNTKISLPDTQIKNPKSLNDIVNIPFIVKHADIAAFSAIRTQTDVQEIMALFDDYDTEDLGFVIKIENKEAFENLPLILFELMKKKNIGLMIARGDLSFEFGPARITEVKDQILWICEAAHLPVIWSSEVLDQLTKTGVPTFSEITDAAKSARTECVMLNEGKYQLEAVIMLKKILSRMEKHAYKKKNQMRSLDVARNAREKIAKQHY